MKEEQEYPIDSMKSVRDDERLKEAVESWMNTSEDTAEGFDDLLSRWRPEEVVSEIARGYWEDRAKVARRVQGAASIAYDRHSVKTIATYYERLSNGGIERVLPFLCSLWKDMGYRVILLTAEAPSEKDYPLPEGIERLVIPHVERKNAAQYRERVEEWARIIREYHVDAVVYHSYWRDALLWDELLIKVCGVAFVLHQHTIFSSPFLEAKTGIANSNVPYEVADALVVLSETDHIFFSYYNGNIHVTMNPLSENISEWMPSFRPENHHILWIGRLADAKRPLDTIPIMKEVVHTVPDAILHIVGESEDGAMEKELKRKIARAGLSGHIVLEGFTKNVKRWYLSSRIFLSTSITEGFPMTLVESKMAGIPCVMYELSYLTLCEGNRGILPVPQRDTKAAADALIRLLKDDALCERYGKEARAHIEEIAQFDFKGKWREIFESLEHEHSLSVTPEQKLMMDTLISHHDIGLQSVKVSIFPKKLTKIIKGSTTLEKAGKRIIPYGMRPLIKKLLGM